MAKHYRGKAQLNQNYSAKATTAGEPIEILAPAVVVAEILTSGEFTGSGDERVRVEARSGGIGHGRLPSSRRATVTSGAVGLSSHRTTMNPRRRPPVSSQ